MDRQSWFEVYGPSEDEMEDLCIMMKNKIKAAYFEAEKPKIIAHRQGVVAQFTGEWTHDAVRQFLEINN